MFLSSAAMESSGPLRPCDRWRDILDARRSSCDLFWLAFHPWSAAQYKYSKNRNFTQIRQDAFRHPAIVKLLMDSESMEIIDSILDEMCHSWSLPTIRFVGYFVTKIMKSIYRHVWIDDYVEVPRNFPVSIVSCQSSLKQVLDQISTEYPVLLMPTHRSYADFIILSYLCFDLNLPLPSIAAGIDFLSLNQVASILRSCGAFFIRRSFKDDSIYWETFAAYVETLIEGGERPVEFFIEGARSRSGKSLPPKTGLLGIAINLFLTARLTDLIILPVSISYDRTLEAELYAKELAAPDFVNNLNCGEKPRETTSHLIAGARNILSDDFGSIHVKFASPLSVRNLSYSFGDIRRQGRCAGQKSQARKSFVDFVARKIITVQVDNLVISTFPLLALTALAELPNEGNFVFFNSQRTLESIRQLSFLFPSKSLSHRNLRIDISDDFKECLRVHRNLIESRICNPYGDVQWPCSTTYDLAVRNDSLARIQLHHYANQALQMVIDLAIVCKSSCDSDVYRSIKRLLSLDFVFCESDIDSMFNRCCSEYPSLSDELCFLLTHHVDFYLQSYLDVTGVLINKRHLISGVHESQMLTINQIVKEIQHDLNIQSDLISNSINMMICRSILNKTDDNKVCLRHDSELHNLFHEISYLLHHEILRQPPAKM